MAGRSANAATIVVAALGLVGFLVFDGVAAGLSLFLAGLTLIAIGIREQP